MRRLAAPLLALAVALAGPALARAASTGRTARAEATLSRAMNHYTGTTGGADGAFVVDLNTGRPLYSYLPDVGRIPASVEKIYTTSTALLRFGPTARLSTNVL